MLKALFLCEAPREKHFTFPESVSLDELSPRISPMTKRLPARVSMEKVTKKLRIRCCSKDTKLKKTLRPCPQAIEDLDFQLFRQSGPSSWRNVINHLLKGNRDCYAIDEHSFDTENDLQPLMLWEQEIL